MIESRVVPMLLTSRFSCCNLDWGFRFGHISSIFHSMASRTRRGTDFVGWESSTTQLKNPSKMLKSLPLVLPIPLSVSARVQGSESGSQGGVQFLESTGDRPPGPRHSAAPALLEARCLVVPNGNHVRVGTLEVPRSTSRTSHPSRLSPEVVLHVEHSKQRLCCGVAVSLWTEGAFDLDRSLPCAIVQLHL